MSAALTLPSRLDLPAATPLAEAFRKHQGADLEVRADEVVHLGTPCLQVLLAASRSWSADGKALVLGAPSDAFLEQLSIFGLSPEALTTAEEER